jgi:hypothetical protein
MFPGITAEPEDGAVVIPRAELGGGEGEGEEEKEEGEEAGETHGGASYSYS